MHHTVMADSTNSGDTRRGKPASNPWPDSGEFGHHRSEDKHADSLDDSMGGADQSFDHSGTFDDDGGAASAASAGAGGETLASCAGGSAEDDRFDRIVGALQDVIMDPRFQDRQTRFCRAHCREFDDTAENKLCYTPLFQEYTELIEQYIQRRLAAAVPGFSMDAFVGMLGTRQDEICGDAFDVLLSCGDFAEFKGLMLSHKRELEGGAGGGAGAAAGPGGGLMLGGGGGGGGGMMLGGMGLCVQPVTNTAALRGGGGDPNGAHAMDFGSSPDQYDPPDRFSKK